MPLHVALLSAILATAAPGYVPTGYVAILEEFNPTAYERLTVARLAFRKTPNGWTSIADGFKSNHPLRLDAAEYAQLEGETLSSLPEQARWVVCFDGKAIGKIATLRPPGWKYLALRGTHLLFDGGRPPWVGQEGSDFAGWPEVPVHRPLVLSADSKCADPLRWKPGRLPPKIAGSLERKIPAVVGESFACEGDEGPHLCPLRIARWTVRRAYRSSEAQWLIEVQGEEASGNTQGFLFYWDSTGMRLLGTDMRVLDAGDYDGDGSTELIVRFQRYNHDGYTLFFGPRLESAVSFGWRYH